MSYFNYAKVELVNDPSYTCSATCFEQTLSFKFTWIERLKKRAVTITGGTGEVYLQNTVISVDEPLEFNANAKDDNYDCSIILQFLPDADTKPDYMNWSRNMFLTVYRITDTEY